MLFALQPARSCPARALLRRALGRGRAFMHMHAPALRRTRFAANRGSETDRHSGRARLGLSQRPPLCAARRTHSRFGVGRALSPQQPPPARLLAAPVAILAQLCAFQPLAREKAQLLHVSVIVWPAHSPPAKHNPTVLLRSHDANKKDGQVCFPRGCGRLPARRAGRARRWCVVSLRSGCKRGGGATFLCVVQRAFQRNPRAKTFQYI